MIIVRPPTKEEYERMHLLRWEIHKQPFGLEKGSEKDDRDEKGHLIVAFDEDARQIVGSARLTPLENSTAQIQYVGIHENYCGKGIGTKIVSQLHEIAKTNGVKKVFLYARRTAEEFYQKLGYVSEGEYFNIAPYNIDEIKMEIKFE